MNKSNEKTISKENTNSKLDLKDEIFYLYN